MIRVSIVLSDRILRESVNTQKESHSTCLEISDDPYESLSHLKVSEMLLLYTALKQSSYVKRSEHPLCLKPLKKVSFVIVSRRILFLEHVWTQRGPGCVNFSTASTKSIRRVPKAFLPELSNRSSFWRPKVSRWNSILLWILRLDNWFACDFLKTCFR